MKVKRSSTHGCESLNRHMVPNHWYLHQASCHDVCRPLVLRGRAVTVNTSCTPEYRHTRTHIQVKSLPVETGSDAALEGEFAWGVGPHPPGTTSPHAAPPPQMLAPTLYSHGTLGFGHEEQSGFGRQQFISAIGAWPHVCSTKL